jgi:hypothetical protein
MLPHIIQSQIDEAEATAAVLSDRADACKPEQEPLRIALLSGAQAIKDMCSLARQLGFAAITNHDTIVNRKAS